MNNSTNPIMAPNRAEVNTPTQNRVAGEFQAPAPEWGTYIKNASAAQRHEAAPQSALLDLWNGILASPNVQNSLVTVGELREVVSLVEPAMILAEQRGTGLGADGFWYPSSWVPEMADRILAATFVCLSAIKSRLGSLIRAGGHAAIHDHVWVAMLLADTDDEVLRRLRRQGNPLIGDGSSTDALRNHIARNRARMNWIATNRRSVNAEGTVQA